MADLDTAATMIGKTLSVAFGIAAAHDVKVRVISTDGAAHLVTKDFSPKRLNLTVVDGVVVKVSEG